MEILEFYDLNQHWGKNDFYIFKNLYKEKNLTIYIGLIMKKELTPEEIEKKKEEKREYHRKYMAERRKNDPSFAEKQREIVRKHHREKYHNDPQYREYNKSFAKQERNRIYINNTYRKYKEAYEKMQQLSIEKS
jgi:hypothetical protein